MYASRFSILMFPYLKYEVQIDETPSISRSRLNLFTFIKTNQKRANFQESFYVNSALFVCDSPQMQAKYLALKECGKGYFRDSWSALFFLVKREMANFCHVNRDFYSSREAWFAKLFSVKREIN